MILADSRCKDFSISVTSIKNLFYFNVEQFENGGKSDAKCQIFRAEISLDSERNRRAPVRARRFLSGGAWSQAIFQIAAIFNVDFDVASVQFQIEELLKGQREWK